MSDRNGNPSRILLGYGIIKLNNVSVGLTRGGGKFTVEKEYRKIEADGDKGTYKGRVTQEKSVPKLKINLLEIIRNDINKIYPGTSLTTDATAGSNTYTVTSNLAAGDVVTFANTTLIANTDFTVGTDTADTASNLAAALDDVSAISAIYTVTSNSDVITITETVAGGGNTPGSMAVDGDGVITGGSPTSSLATGYTKMTGKGKIEDVDYNDTIEWVGVTKGGKGCKIVLYNAINLDNPDWTLAEKDDVIAGGTFEGTYTEDSAEDYEPWEVIWEN